MASSKTKEKDKKMQDKYQAVLSRLLREEDNKYCIDCDAKGPRWASWNLGIFLCIRCAGIHRNLGVHISRVKSVNLDSWTEQQIHSMEDTGNTIGRRLYEGNLPEGYRRPQTDSALEHFVRAKYEHKKYINKNYVRPPVRRTDFIDTESEKKRKPKGKSNNVSLQKPKESSSSSSSGATKTSAAAPSKPASVVARPETIVNKTTATLSVQQTHSHKSVSLPTTPVSKRKAVDDLLGLDTPPPNNDLLSMNTPQHPIGQSASSSNLIKDHGIETSLFGDELDTKIPDQSSQKNKDSIMALYGSGSQQKQPAYGVPGGMYIPSYQQTHPQQQQQQQQPQQPQSQQYNVSNGYPNGMPNTAATVGAGGFPNTQNGMIGAVQQQGNQGIMGTNQSMVGTPQQAMMGTQQQGMMGTQQQGMMGTQQTMMGTQQQRMMGTQQQSMMGRQQGTMGLSAGMYQAQAQQQQQAYLSQIQQQMKSLQVAPTTGVPQQQQQMPMGQTPWPQGNPTMQQQPSGVTAAAGGGGIGWGATAPSGQTLSTNLWQ